MVGFPPILLLIVPVGPISLWNILSPAPKVASPPSDTTRSGTLGGWLSEVCNDVCIEPTLQPLSGETFNGASAIIEDGARLDIAANGFLGGRRERNFFDVRVFNPLAPSNCQQSLAGTYRKHERAKIRAYEQRVREVEPGSFSPVPLLRCLCRSQEVVEMQQV